MENLEIFPLREFSREFIFFNARLRLAAASALEATSIQTFEISETCVWHLSRR